MDRIDPKCFVEEHSLFQRVVAPNPRVVRAFGCGGSGLTPEATIQISEVFSFDYMGDAEFEHGECANCLSFMCDNADDLVTSEYKGFFFLTHVDVMEKAHKLWDYVIANNGNLRHYPQLKNEFVLGWFDFRNGFFVCRTEELRDKVHQLILE